MREADFSERIKTILCERVGGRCSNPNCRRETLGPHREGDKRLSIGEAAHILGASPKGAIVEWIYKFDNIPILWWWYRNG